MKKSSRGGGIRAYKFILTILVLSHEEKQKDQFKRLRTFKDGKIKSTVFTRPHAVKRHKAISPMLRNGDLKFWRPVNFEVEYFLNEETEGVLTVHTMIPIFL